MSTFKEYTLSTNDISKPKVLENDKAIGTLLYRLIMLNPGDNPLYPAMGVGLVTKWRYMMKSQLPDLKKNISDQISVYLPELQAVDITLKINSVDKTLTIEISSDGVIYSIDTSQTTTPITISDLKK